MKEKSKKTLNKTRNEQIKEKENGRNVEGTSKKHKKKSPGNQSNMKGTIFFDFLYILH